MDIGEALRLFGLVPGYDEDELAKAYRRSATCTHPDLGGSAEAFADTLRARDTLLKQLHRPRSSVIVDDAKPWRTFFALAMGRGRKRTRNLL